MRKSRTRPGRWASWCYRSAPRQYFSWPTTSRQIRWMSPFAWRRVLVANACVTLSQQLCKYLAIVICTNRMRKTCKVYQRRMRLAGSQECLTRSIVCIGSEKCSTPCAGQYTGKERKPTLILEAVASQDLHIWHAIFGMLGVHNDINVLDSSPLFQDLCSDRAAPVNSLLIGTTM